MNPEYTDISDEDVILKPIDRIKKPFRWIFDSLVRNAGYMMGVTIANGLTGFLFWTIATRVQPPDQVGIASSIISVVQLLSGVAGLGLGIGLVGFLAGAIQPERMLNSALTLTMMMSVLVGGIYLLGLPIWSPSIHLVAQEWWMGVGYVIYLGVTALGTLIQLAFLSVRAAKYAFVHSLWFNAVRLFIVFFSSAGGFTGIVSAMMVGFICADLIAIFYFLPRVLPNYRFRFRLSTQVLRELMPFSVVNYETNLFIQLPMLIGPPLALELIDASSSAFAYSGWLVGSILVSPGIALAQSAFAEASTSPHKLKNILTRAGIISVGLTTPLAIILALGGKFILGAFGGVYAQEGSALLRWIALTAPIFSLNALYITSLRVRKRTVELLIISSLMAFIALITPLLFIQRWGLISMGIGWLGSNVLIGLWVLRAFLQGEWGT